MAERFESGESGTFFGGFGRDVSRGLLVGGGSNTPTLSSGFTVLKCLERFSVQSFRRCREGVEFFKSLRQRKVDLAAAQAAA